MLTEYKKCREDDKYKGEMLLNRKKINFYKVKHVALKEIGAKMRDSIFKFEITSWPKLKRRKEGESPF